MKIDLNSDLGEGYGPWGMGDDRTMFEIVTSANIACGGHASDPETMFQTLQLARENNVVIGAHPGYADPLGFGRRVIPMLGSEISHMVAAQIGALQAMAKLAGTKVSYVKPHGALANLAARDRSVADAIVSAVHAVDPALAYLAISGTQSEKASRAIGLQTFSEIFADRGYQENGELVPRGEKGAMIESASEAAERLIEFMKTSQMPVVGGGSVKLNAQSICVHGDSDHAVAMSREIKTRLMAEGIEVKSFIENV